ncbi:serine hydrolase domain-containing protein [Mucisphaera sp.]|uniref:serine hydrolase domain-containing protein n=1 Tax=Mucisphaera sp. TaxID=2913024 RepID=UPI003D0BBBFF
MGDIAAADTSIKTMSGALMMSVAESSVLPFSLDSRINDFIPEYNTPDKRDITIRQALSHTSGLPGLDASSLILSNPNLSLQPGCGSGRSVTISQTSAHEDEPDPKACFYHASERVVSPSCCLKVIAYSGRASSRTTLPLKLSPGLSSF